MENLPLDMANVEAKPGRGDVDENAMSIDLLNDLISLNRGLVNVYHTAVERLENETNINLLQTYAAQHEQFVAELGKVVVGLGGDPAQHGDGSSMVKQAWVTLKAAFTEGDGPILAEVTQDAATVLEAYGAAMNAHMPDEGRDVIRHHMTYSRLAHEKLAGLSAAFNS